MAILNATPDSFYRASRVKDVDDALRQAEKHIREGADILDLGAYSSRPGAQDIPVEEELRRLLPLVEKISADFPDTPLSIDTFRAVVASEAAGAGADMINDISAGDDDEEMLEQVAGLKLPYVAMHKKGSPLTMQSQAHYGEVVTEVLDYLHHKLSRCRALGIQDVVIDPGFGFGKNSAHNYRLLKHLSVFRESGAPLLIGVSRKGMIWKNLEIDPAESLNGTTALHMLALQNGADILRVHDVREAAEAIRLYGLYREA